MPLLQKTAHGDGNEDRGNTAGQRPNYPARRPLAGEAVVNHRADNRQSAEDDYGLENHSLAIDRHRHAALGGSDHGLHDGHRMDCLFRVHAECSAAGASIGEFLKLGQQRIDR